MVYVPLKTLGGILFLLWLCLAAVAKAEERQSDKGTAYEFDMPAQPLSESLRQLSNQTETFLLFPFELVEHRMGNSVRGSYTLQQAVEMLLAGSGLTGSVSEKQVLMISKARSTTGGVPDDGTQNKERGSSMQRRSSLTRFGAFVGSIASVFSAQAHGQEANGEISGLEEIIVTSERRTADVQDVGASVAVRSGDELSREGKATVDQIIADIPGISGTAFPGESGAGINPAAFGTDSPMTGIAIRGVRANTGAFGLPNNATTAAYVDGVYGGVGGTYDIDRVEVLRGPQGTLYGRSATGGVIAFYTRDPNTTELEGDASVGLGNYDLRRVGGAVNVPVIDDKFAIRVSANQHRRQGYDYDYSPGYSSKIDDARVKALYTPTENLSVLLGVALENTTTYAGATRYVATGTDSWFKQTLPEYTGNSVVKSRQYWSKISWDLGDASLIYQPSLRTFEKYALLNSSAPFGGNYRERNNYPDDRFLTHELQLTSNPGSKFDWQVGAIYYNNDAHFFADYYRIESDVFVNQMDLRRDTTQYGLYGEATFPLTDRTRLTAGVRQDKTKVEVEEVVVINTNGNSNAGTPTAGLPLAITTYTLSRENGTRNFNNTTFKLRLEQDLTDQAMVYAMVSSAFIPGDVAVTTANPPYAYAFSAETLTSYEAGLKSRFFDNRLQVNGAVYYYDYGGRQVNTQVVSGDPSSTITLVTPAKYTGAELETLYQLTDADRIRLDIAYVNAKYTDVSPEWRTQFAYDDIGGISPLTARLSYDHDFTLPNSSKLRFGADASYVDSYLNGDVSNTDKPLTDWYRVDSYIIGNANLDWTSPGGRWGAGGYVRNVSDERYKLSTNLLGTSRFYGFSDPRTYGVSLRVKF